MSKRKSGRLNPDDLELWERVRNSASPLHPQKRAPVQIDKTVSNKKKSATPAPKFNPPVFRVGEAASSATSAPLTSGQPAKNIDRKVHTKLKRGKLTPEARIDLHGMTQDQALPALTRFISNSSARGLRLVLVITGKGRPRPDYGPIPERPGVLRRNVPQWLRNPILKPLVQEVVQSHISHGGEGAYYVYLRRLR